MLNKRLLIGLILIAIVTITLRFWDIGARSLWFDEAVEYWSSVTPLLSIPTTARHTGQPPLYNIILHTILFISDDPVWLRSFSVIFSCLGIVGVLALAFQVSGWHSVVIAGIIYAILPSDIRYAQEVAEYALALCLMTWGTYFLYQANKRLNWEFWLLWGSLTTLSIYTHYGSGIVFVGLSICVFIENLARRDFQQISRQIIISIAIVLTLVPLLIYLLPAQITSYSRSAAPFSGFIPEIISGFDALAETFMFAISGWPFSPLPTWILKLTIYLYIGLITIPVIVEIYRHTLEPSSDQDGEKTKLTPNMRIALWFWSVFGVYFVLVRLGVYGQGHFGFRYAIFLTPLFIVTSAASMTWLFNRQRFLNNQRLLRAIGCIPLVLIILISAISLPNKSISDFTRKKMIWPETEQMKEILLFWNDYRKDGDVTYVHYAAAPAFRYYLRYYNLEIHESLPGWWFGNCFRNNNEEYCEENNVFYGRYIRHKSDDFKRQAIQDHLSSNLRSTPDRLWVIFETRFPPNEYKIMLGGLLENYEILANIKKAGAQAYLLKKEIKNLP